METSKTATKREGWATRIGAVLAVAGSAIGLGNFLRFPGQAAQHGGGAFMLPYFAALLCLGIPICWAEWTMARYGGLRGFHSAPGIFGVIWRRPAAKYFGVLALLVPLVIYMYYVVIEAWCLTYAWNYMTGRLMQGNNPAAYRNFFDSLVGKQANGALFAPAGVELLWILVGVFALNLTIIYRGISRGIERFCRFAIPLMAVAALVVLARVLTLGTPNAELPERNVINGLGFMWNPDPSKLGDPATWLAAAGQIFFSLGVGFGIIINYASYLRRNDDIVLSGATSAMMNEFFEVCLGGLITLPAAFMFVGIASDGLGTFDLGFKAIPNVFALMPGGRFFGFVWFFMLFLAAITSSIAMLQPVAAFLEEGLGIGRRRAVALLGGIAAAGTLFTVYFSRGLAALDALDFWVGTFLIVCLALFQALLYGWVLGIERGEVEAHRGAQMRIPRVVQWMLKYVAPTYLVVMLGWFAVNNIAGTSGYAAKVAQDRIALAAVCLIAVVGLLLAVMVRTAGKRWANRLSGESERGLP